MAGGVINSVEEKPMSQQPQRGKFQEFGHFLYNKDEGKVLGRTGRSWRLGYQPWISSNAESTLIAFDPNDNKTYVKYTAVLDSFFNKYNANDEETGNLKTGYRKCNETQSNDDDVKEACIFDLGVFGGENECGPPNFGFDEGKPCVVLTLNKLIEWEPVSFPNESYPLELPKSAHGNDVAVACGGEYSADDQNMGQVTYMPATGIKKQYFPYKIFTNNAYHQPFAMVKFQDLQPGVLVQIECKAYAYNIVHDRANRLGMVHFELLLKKADKDDDDEEGSGM